MARKERTPFLTDATDPFSNLASYIPNSATPSTVQTKPSYAPSGMAREENAPEAVNVGQTFGSACHPISAKPCHCVLKLLVGLNSVVRRCHHVHLHPVRPDRTLLFLCVLYLWSVESEAKKASR